MGEVGKAVLRQRIGDSLGDSKLTPPEQVPGKSTLAGQQQGPAAPASQAHVDYGSKCDGLVHGANCFLSDGQRARLVDEFGKRVLAAEGHYSTALLNIKMETIVQKDPDLSWAFEMVIGALTSFVSSALLLSMKALRAGKAEEALWALKIGDATHGNDPSTLTEVVEALNGTSDASLTSIVKAATDKGKTATSSAVKSAQNDDEKSDKGVKLDYVKVLQNKAGPVFQQLREDPPSHATDAELLALFEAFDASHQGVDQYETELRAHIQRYQASFVRKIGNTAEGSWHAKTGKPEDINSPNQTECKVVIVTHSSDPKNIKFAYKTRSILKTPNWGGGYSWEYVGGIDYHAIEPDLVDVAIAKHNAEWQTPPLVEQMDDNLQPTWKVKPPPVPKNPIAALNKPDRPTNPDKL